MSLWDKAWPGPSIRLGLAGGAAPLGDDGLIPARFLPEIGSVPAGSRLRASAIAADGETYTTAQIVSPQLYSIRDYGGFLKTSGADTWDIVLDRRPSPVPTTLTVRANGMNRINNLHPQVDGTWPVVPVAGDPYRFTLVGSNYGPMYADGGVAYVPGTLINASAELDKLAVWLRAHGGGQVSMPPYGGLYLQSGPLRTVENAIFDCNNCFLFKADAKDQTAIFNRSVGSGAEGPPPNFGNVSKLIIRNLWVYDNRAYQLFRGGQHAINLGTSNSPEKISQWIELDGVHVRNGSGYGESSDKNNGTIVFTRKNGSIKWTNGDSRDRKNDLSLNDSINFQNETHDWVALGDLGTNLRAVRGLANPFSVTSVGASTVRVAWSKHGWKTGRKVIISGGVQGNGLTIPSTAVAITVTSAGQFTIPATGAALNTASWGGTAVQILPCIANNGVTTFNGEKYIEIPRSTDAATRVGEKAILGTDITLNNVPLGGVWDCIATTPTALRLAHMDPDTGLATGATANASGTGGGDSITFLCAHISSGDRVIDSRGARTSLRSIRSRGEFFGRAGITARGGTVANVNGDGAHHISIYDYKIVDLTPAWIAAAGGGGTGLALDCDGALVEDVYIKGAGLGVGVLFGASSVGSQLSKYEIDGPQTGIQLRGSRHIIGKGKVRNSSQLGVALWGYIVSNRADLPENAFTPVAIGDPRAIVSSPAHGISSGTNATIIGISQSNPVVITTSAPHGMTTGVRVGIKDVVGMTQMNGRVAAFTVLSTTTFSMPIDATGFSAYVSGGKTVNKQVAFSGVESGSGMTILGSNRATYGAVYIDADRYYIDCSENVVGDAALANSTESFGGADANAGYGDTPNTASRNTLDGIEFEHDVGNTATAILHGAALAVTVGQRGRVADTIVRNCRVQGYATPLTDYDANGILGPAGTSTALYKNNQGLFNQGPVKQRYTSSGSFAGHPLAVAYDIDAWGGTGGGASGRRGAASGARAGGTGGFGSVMSSITLKAADVTLPVPITIGAGGAGGAAVTTDSTNGNNGSAGGDTTFGSYLRARGGLGGSGGTTGSSVAAGQTAPINLAGMYTPVTASATADINNLGPNGGQRGGGAGGPGGSISNTNVLYQGAAAPFACWGDPALTQPTGYTPVGANGADGANSSLLDHAGYGGSGGSPTDSGPGGNGGVGGRGSGGGGGAGSLNGFNSGAGGPGGGGQVSVTMYF